MKHRLLLLAPHASYRTVPFQAAGTTVDIEVVVAADRHLDDLPTPPGGIAIALSDPEQSLETLLEEHGQRPFDGVYATDDSTVELAARFAEMTGLPNNPVGAARAARRKDLGRDRMAAAGLPVPGYRVVDAAADLPSQIEDVRYPCVAKPLAMAASSGVIRADTTRELMAACERIVKIATRAGARGGDNLQILVEDYIPGIEIAVEGLLDRGKLTILEIFDKPDPLEGPYFEESIYITPTALDARTQTDIEEALVAACGAYGLVHGPVHAECRLNDTGVWVIEVAARTIGGKCARLLEYGTGYSLEALVLANAVGRPVSLSVASDWRGVFMLPVPGSGVLRRVEGIGEARRIPGIEEVIVDVREGQLLVPWPEGSGYPGFVFARAASREKVESALRQAQARLRFVLAPALPLRVAGRMEKP